MDISLILTVLGIHLLAVISPGPDLIVCLKNALQYGRKVGVYTAIGFGAGIGVHILYCSLGLALLISQSIQLFTAIKIMGACYLLYMGRNSLMSKTNSFEHSLGNNHTSHNTKTPRSALRDGFLTNVLNPKATLFFLSLFTFVIDPHTSDATLLVISGMMMLNTVLRFSFVSVCCTHHQRRQALDRYQGIINKAFGGILLFLGIKVLTMSNE